MLKRCLLAIALFMLTGPAHSEEYCVRPVPESGPTLDIEQRVPSRIFRNPRVFPGYEGLVLNGFYREKLFQFNGEELLEIQDDFPHVLGFSDNNIYSGSNDSSYGFGSKPKSIFYLPIGETEWKGVGETKDYERALFDRGSGDAYFLKSGYWKQVRDGKIIGKANLPDLKNPDVKAIRSVSELPGIFVHLTSHENAIGTKIEIPSIWYQPESGDWQEIDIPFQDGYRPTINFDRASIDVSDDLVSIFRDGQRAPLFFTRTSTGLNFLGVGPAGY